MNADDTQRRIYSAVPMPPTSGRRLKSVIRNIQHLHKKNAKPLDTRPRAYNGSAQVQKSKEQTAERGRNPPSPAVCSLHPE